MITEPISLSIISRLVRGSNGSQSPFRQNCGPGLCARADEKHNNAIADNRTTRVGHILVFSLTGFVWREFWSNTDSRTVGSKNITDHWIKERKEASSTTYSPLFVPKIKATPTLIRPADKSISFYSMSVRACSARAAPIAVSTFFTSSGGGNTAFMPSDSIQSSRAQPFV